MQKFISMTTLMSILSYSSLSAAREYDCNDLRSLQNKIKRNAQDNAASVSAMIIRFMGRNPNPCVENILETSNAVQVSYLDRGPIVSDTFNFSDDNQLVSMRRTLSDLKTETINF